MVTFEDIKNDEEIKILIEDTERQLMELGYTEHGYRHLGIVSNTAEYKNSGTIISRRMASATFLPHEITKLKELSITLLSTFREMVSEIQNCT